MSSLVTFLFVTLFVLSLSVLLFELSLTRIFSIMLWYNYAFMAISIAFFGLGIGALVVHILKNKIQEKDLPSKILQSVIAFAISIPVFLFIIGHIIPPNVSFIYLFYLASSIPFFFAGTSMALVYLTMPREITRLYFVDLVGAAIAAIVLDPLIGEVGAENVLLLTGLLAIGSALLCTVISIGKKNVLSVTIESKIKYYAVIVVATSALLFITNTTGFNLLLIPPGESKGLHNVLANPSYEHLLTQWNSFSRIDVIRNNQDPSTVGSILIDADALTPIHRWNNASTSTKTVTLKGNETIWSNTIPLNNTNYIESTFRVTDEYKNNQNHSGIVWNDGNNKEYYAFLRSNRLSVYTPDQGEFQSAPLIENREIGKWFTLKVVYTNNTINIFLDNIPKIQIPNVAANNNNNNNNASQTISKVGIRSFNNVAEFKPLKVGSAAIQQQGVNYAEIKLRTIGQSKQTDNHFGLTWNDDQKEYYAFLRQDRLSVFTPVDGEFLSTKLVPPREKGTWYTLKIVYTDHTIKIFLNDVLKLQTLKIPSKINNHITAIGIRSYNSDAEFGPMKVGRVSKLDTIDSQSTLELLRVLTNKKM
jgi:hypothetical protein